MRLTSSIPTPSSVPGEAVMVRLGLCTNYAYPTSSTPRPEGACGSSTTPFTTRPPSGQREGVAIAVRKTCGASLSVVRGLL